MAEEIRVDTYNTGILNRGPGVRRTAWGAIFAGTFVAIATQILLVALGTAIGAATVDPTTEANPAQGVGIFAGIWWLVTGLISLFLGGLVTAWLAGFPRWIDGMLHGLVMWALTLALSAYLVTTSASTLLGGAMSTMQSAMQSPATQNLTDESSLEQLQQRAQSMFGGSQQLDPQSRQVIQRHIPDPQNATPDQRDRAVSELMVAQNLPQNEAQQKVQTYVSGQQGSVLGSPEQTPGEVREAGEKAANAVTSAATWTFFALLLGLAAAAVGGAVGRPKNLVDDTTTTHRRVVT